MKNIDNKQELEDQFIMELTALTRKYGISIDGCGCCGSPYLDTETDTSDERACYFVNNGEIKWFTPIKGK